MTGHFSNGFSFLAFMLLILWPHVPFLSSWHPSFLPLWNFCQIARSRLSQSPMMSACSPPPFILEVEEIQAVGKKDGMKMKNWGCFYAATCSVLSLSPITQPTRTESNLFSTQRPGPGAEDVFSGPNAASDCTQVWLSLFDSLTVLTYNMSRAGQQVIQVLHSPWLWDSFGPTLPPALHHEQSPRALQSCAGNLLHPQDTARSKKEVPLLRPCFKVVALAIFFFWYF